MNGVECNDLEVKKLHQIWAQDFIRLRTNIDHQESVNQTYIIIDFVFLFLIMAYN